MRDKGCSTKFFNRNVCFAYNGDAYQGGKNGTSLLLKDGWEPVETPKAPRAPRAKKSPKVATTEPIVTAPVYEPEPTAEPEPIIEPEPTTEPTVTEPEPQPTVVEEPVAAKEPEPTATTEPTAATVVTVAALCGIEADKLKKKLAKKYGEMAEEILAAAVTLLQGAITGVTNKSEVKAIVEEVFASYATAEPKKAALVAKAAKAKTGAKEYYCAEYADILEDVKDGFNVYLFGTWGWNTIPKRRCSLRTTSVVTATLVANISGRRSMRRSPRAVCTSKMSMTVRMRRRL